MTTATTAAPRAASRCVLRVLCMSLLGAAGLALAPPAGADDAAIADARAHATALSTAFRKAAEQASPSVVLVRSEVKPRRQEGRAPGRRGGGEGGENPFRGTPFEDMFPEGFDFEGQEGGRMPRSGVGSGVIVDPAGIVLTNNHVVEGADEVVVELTDGREFKAAEIKTDPDSDLAVIKLADARDLPTAKLGDSDELSIGDWVIAIGNPFELETTVSAGIISGKGRELGGIRRAQFLQTDAAINPGNSGGPLVNLAGEVIGINTAIASMSGGYQGVGFAIPVNLAKWVSRQLIDKGEVERAFIGVQMGPLDRRMAAKLGITSRKGVLVNDVVPGSPAAEAGVQELDVITGFDGKDVDGTRSLQEMVERSAMGKKHSLTVLRDGKPLELAIAVRPLPKDLASRGPARQPRGAEAEETFFSEEFGLEVRDKASLPEDPYEGFAGVIVDRVEPDGVAAEAGIGPGVLVRAVGKTDVASVDDFAKAIEKETAADGVVLKIRTPSGNRVVLLQRQ